MNKVIYFIFFQNIFYEVFLKMRANRANNRDTVIMIDLSIFSDANTSTTTTSFSQEPSKQSSHAYKLPGLSIRVHASHVHQCG